MKVSTTSASFLKSSVGGKVRFSHPSASIACASVLPELPVPELLVLVIAGPPGDCGYTIDSSDACWRLPSGPSGVDAEGRPDRRGGRIDDLFEVGSGNSVRRRGPHCGRRRVEHTGLSGADPRRVADQPVEIGIDEIERIEHATLDRVGAAGRLI